MLEIKDLHASVNGKEILKGINLSIKKGEVHAITVSYTHLTLPTNSRV